MSWSGFDSNGNFIWLEENAKPEDYASCGTMIAGFAGVVLSGYFVYKYWPLVLGCAIAAFVLAAISNALRKWRNISIINTIWISVVFIAFTFFATALLVFESGRIFASILSVIMLIAEVFMAWFISMLTGWLAKKFFGRRVGK